MRSLLAVGCSSIALLVAPAAWAQGWGAQGGVSTGGGGSYSYAGPAVGDTHPNFGLANQFVLTTNLDIGFIYSTTGGGDAPNDDSTSDFAVLFGTNIGRAWALDYFVIDNLSVGGQITYQTDNDGDDNQLSIAPRLGYNIAFSDDFSVWPQAGVVFVSEKDTNTDAAGGTTKTTEKSLGLFLNVPVLYHITNHFFLGAGPFISTELSHSSKASGGDSVDQPKTTAFGVQSLIGGYLLAHGDAHPRPPRPARPRDRRARRGARRGRLLLAHDRRDALPAATAPAPRQLRREHLAPAEARLRGRRPRARLDRLHARRPRRRHESAEA